MFKFYLDSTAADINQTECLRHLPQHSALWKQCINISCPADGAINTKMFYFWVWHFLSQVHELAHHGHPDEMDSAEK